MLGQKTHQMSHSVGMKHNSMVKKSLGEKNTFSPNGGHNFSNAGSATTDIFNTANSMLSWNEPLKGKPVRSAQGW